MNCFTVNEIGIEHNMSVLRMYVVTITICLIDSFHDHFLFKKNYSEFELFAENIKVTAGKQNNKKIESMQTTEITK